MQFVFHGLGRNQKDTWRHRIVRKCRGERLGSPGGLVRPVQPSCGLDSRYHRCPPVRCAARVGPSTFVPSACVRRVPHAFGKPAGLECGEILQRRLDPARRLVRPPGAGKIAQRYGNISQTHRRFLTNGRSASHRVIDNRPPGRSRIPEISAGFAHASEEEERVMVGGTRSVFLDDLLERGCSLPGPAERNGHARRKDQGARAGRGILRSFKDPPTFLRRLVELTGVEEELGIFDPGRQEIGRAVLLQQQP